MASHPSSPCAASDKNEDSDDARSQHSVDHARTCDDMEKDEDVCMRPQDEDCRSQDNGNPDEAEEEDCDQDESDKTRPYYVIYQKKCYVVPPECIVFNLRRPITVPNGTVMGEMHDTKAYKQWVNAHIGWKNMIIVSATIDNEVQMHMYVTFTTPGNKSCDSHILRPVPKAVIKAYMAWWEQHWNEKRKSKKEMQPFVNFVVGSDAQISPERHRWERLAGDTLPATEYVKKKPSKRSSEKSASPIRKKDKGKSSAKSSSHAAEKDDSDNERETHNDDAETEETPSIVSAAGATVTIPLSLFEAMAASHWCPRPHQPQPTK